MGGAQCCESSGSAMEADLERIAREEGGVTLVAVADRQNHRIQLFENGSHVRSLGCKGSEPGQFLYPCGVAVVERLGGGGDDLLLVADTKNHRVQVLRLEDGSHVRTIGSQGSEPGQLSSPIAVAVDGQGHLIVAEYGNDRVQVLRLQDGGHVRCIGGASALGGWRQGSGSSTSKRSPRGPGQFNCPSDLALDGKGHLLVADTKFNRVQMFRLEDGSHVSTIGGNGSGPGQFSYPEGVAVDGQGHLIVADSKNHRVQVLRLEDGSHVRTIGSHGRQPGMFNYPMGVAVDGKGNLLVADAGNNRVQMLRLADGLHVRSNSEIHTVGGPLNPRGMAVVHYEDDVYHSSSWLQLTPTHSRPQPSH